MHLLNRNNFKCLHSLFYHFHAWIKLLISLSFLNLIQCLSGIIVSTKIFSSKTVFNIDNNEKCFLSSKSAYYNDFWRIMRHWNFFVNNNIFINVSNDECCVPKCKLKLLKPIAAQLALTVNQNQNSTVCVHTAGGESVKVAGGHSFSMWAGGELRRERRGEFWTVRASRRVEIKSTLW